jgi:hypothetical protein
MRRRKATVAEKRRAVANNDSPDGVRAASTEIRARHDLPPVPGLRGANRPAWPCGKHENRSTTERGIMQTHQPMRFGREPKAGIDHPDYGLDDLKVERHPTRYVHFVRDDSQGSIYTGLGGELCQHPQSVGGDWALDDYCAVSLMAFDERDETDRAMLERCRRIAEMLGVEICG